ncbi:MAG: glutamate--tRNA ligase [Deltaproteobacteria bacterium]|jgi:glutamyl-tRNA synthetase|nr:glutamate--tRNA ligase [Deltaproteobacteria bacterium]
MITRFAPSPTGHLHIGGARTALFNYLLARGLGGKFVLRVEDTDAQRSTEEYTKSILSAMEWLGLSWDGEPVFQTDRTGLHVEHAERLVAEGRAYWCRCAPEEIEESRKKAMAEGGKPRYDGRCRELGLGPSPGAAIRFKCPPGGQVRWRDLIKGPIVFEASELDDLVILRSDGLPTYNMAVVVDDITMGVTHVVRGDDHVNNTPRQILLYRALGAELPEFGHVPMILGSDKSRLSKRHGATSVMAYQEAGYLPQALVNYLARLGWSHGDQEIFSLEEMVGVFSLRHVGKAAAVFDPNKLDWLNAHYIKNTPPDELCSLLKPFLEKRGLPAPDGEKLLKIVLTLRERSKTLAEMAGKAEFYFGDLPKFDPKSAEQLLALLKTPEGADAPAKDAGGKAILEKWLGLLQELPRTREDFDQLLSGLAAELGVKAGVVAKPLRLALTGSTASPGLYEIMEILGPDVTLGRIRAAAETPEGYPQVRQPA